MVISNAGVGGYAPVDEIDPSAVDRLWTLNSIVPILPTRAALPYLLASGSGGVITVASLLAFGGGHGSEFPRVLYAGAKAATAAFARTLAGELSGTGVIAIVVCPGLIATEWLGGRNHGNHDAMSAHDVAAAWTAFAGGETVCVPALNNTDALARLAAAEAVVMAGGNRSVLADRSADRCPTRTHRLP